MKHKQRVDEVSLGHDYKAVFLRLNISFLPIRHHDVSLNLVKEEVHLIQYHPIALLDYLLQRWASNHWVEKDHVLALYCFNVQLAENLVLFQYFFSYLCCGRLLEQTYELFCQDQFRLWQQSEDSLHFTLFAYYPQKVTGITATHLYQRELVLLSSWVYFGNLFSYFWMDNVDFDCIISLLFDWVSF